MSEDLIDHGALPPYRRRGACPKCHYMSGTTQYHEGYHLGPCSIRGADQLASLWRIWTAYPGASQEWIDAVGRQKEIPEHFERECPNCKHRWAEGVIE